MPIVSSSAASHHLLYFSMASTLKFHIKLDMISRGLPRKGIIQRQSNNSVLMADYGRQDIVLRELKS